MSRSAPSSQFGPAPVGSRAVRLGIARSRHRPVRRMLQGGNVGPERARALARAVPLVVKHSEDLVCWIFLAMFAVGTFVSDGHYSVCVKVRGSGRAVSNGSLIRGAAGCCC